MMNLKSIFWFLINIIFLVFLACAPPATPLPLIAGVSKTTGGSSGGSSSGGSSGGSSHGQWVLRWKGQWHVPRPNKQEVILQLEQRPDLLWPLCLVWSLIAPVLLQYGPKAEVIDWLVNCLKVGWSSFKFVLSSQGPTSLSTKFFLSHWIFNLTLTLLE